MNCIGALARTGGAEVDPGAEELLTNHFHLRGDQGDALFAAAGLVGARKAFAALCRQRIGQRTQTLVLVAGILGIGSEADGQQYQPKQGAPLPGDRMV